MLSRSKSAQGLRVLGSNVGSTGHQDTEMEYTFIKGLVEAYSQQCMPPSYNKIPLRADKWTPVREGGPRYRLDLSPMTFTPRWATSSFSRLQDARARDRRDGHNRRHARGRGVSGSSEPKARTSVSRPVSPVRNTFQRSWTTVEEKVLPVWTPELKEGIIFSHRFASTSSLSNVSTSGDANAGDVSQNRSPGDNSRCWCRSASPSRVPPPQPKIHRPLTTKREHVRPKTVSTTTHRSSSLKPKVKMIDDTDVITRCSTDKPPSRTKENVVEGLTKMTQDQDTQTLSLDVFLPREGDGGSSASCHQLQVQPSARSKVEESREGIREELFSTRNKLLSDLSQRPNRCNHHPTNQEHGDNVEVIHNGNTPTTNHVCCPRYQNSIGKLCGTPAKSNCKKWIHCELFGPALCSDCRLEREKHYNTNNSNNNRLVVHDDDFSMPTLSLRGRNSVLSPRN